MIFAGGFGFALYPSLDVACRYSLALSLFNSQPLIGVCARIRTYVRHMDAAAETTQNLRTKPVNVSSSERSSELSLVRD